MAKKKTKRTEPDDIDSIRHARSLVRKVLAERGIDDPEAHVRQVVERARAELAQRQAESA